MELTSLLQSKNVHEVLVACCVHLPPGKNKRVGKQLASQKILQMLHPHVKNWGSLLRMYGRESNKMVKKVSPILSTYCKSLDLI